LKTALDSHFPLKIIADSANYCAIEKPIGIETGALMKKNFSLAPIHCLDVELGGIILCAKNKQFYNDLRNAYGSEAMAFHFTILAKGDANLAEEMVCDLPIAQHRGRNCMIISHGTGKKARTIFKKIETVSSLSLWSAETNFLRKHQIRLHGHERGMKIVGEDIYDKIPLPFLSDFKRKVKPNRRGIPMPLYPAICIYLSKITFNDQGERICIASPLPDKFTIMLKIIQKWN
jgi:23S rRNA pseudouridine1911/1915/1917 synthase